MLRTCFTPLSICTLLLLAACGNQAPTFDTLEEEIDFLIDENRYSDALSRLSVEDRNKPETRRQLEKTHLNYGLYNMQTFDEGEMRTRMNEALRQFTEVLRINPENEMARAQIDQILGVYSTIPNREPEEDVVEGLREVGIKI